MKKDFKAIAKRRRDLGIDLWYAIDETPCDPDAILSLIDQQADLACTQQGMTPLHNVFYHLHDEINRTKADRENLAKIAMAIIDQGIALDVENNQKVTPFMQACSSQYPKIALALLAKGISLEKTDNDGYSGLHWAMTMEEDAGAFLARVLDVCPADLLNAQNYFGSTPLHMLAQEKHADIRGKMLIEKGAAIDLLNEDGATPLMEAIRCRATNFTAMLLQYGASLDLVDKQGRTVFDYAQAVTHVDKTDLFEKMLQDEVMRRRLRDMTVVKDDTCVQPPRLNIPGRKIK